MLCARTGGFKLAHTLFPAAYSVTALHAPSFDTAPRTGCGRLPKVKAMRIMTINGYRTIIACGPDIGPVPGEIDRRAPVRHLKPSGNAAANLR